MSDSNPESVAVEVIQPSALEAITRGEIDVQIATAKRYPRSIAQFRKRALEMATLDEETAASCFYRLPRGGKAIEGPSVRLAEIVASAYGNIRVQTRITNVGDKTITAMAVVHDLETNVAYSMEVERGIIDKYGKRYKDDMVVVTGQAAQSIVKRNAIYSVVPRSYVDQIYREAQRVAVGDVSTLDDRRHKAIEHFIKSGITVDRIYAALGVNGEDEVTLDHLATLTGLKTAIRDGQTTLDESFPRIVAIKSPVFGGKAEPANGAPANGNPSAAPVDSEGRLI